MQCCGAEPFLRSRVFFWAAPAQKVEKVGKKDSVSLSFFSYQGKLLRSLQYVLIYISWNFWENSLQTKILLNWMHITLFETGWLGKISFSDELIISLNLNNTPNNISPRMIFKKISSLCTLFERKKNCITHNKLLQTFTTRKFYNLSV